jgi:hypothetical protein
MKNAAASVSVPLLLVLLLLTALYSTAQAGREGLFRQLERFRSRNNNRDANNRHFTATNAHGNHSVGGFEIAASGRDYCSVDPLVVSDAAAAAAATELSVMPSVLQYRGGVALSETDEDEAVTGDVPTGRLDVAAKAKSYGKFEFSMFQKGDGSDEDPDGIPTRYMAMQLQRSERAKKATLATLRWREERAIDSILKRPHPDFDVAKAVFPHYFVTRDNGGHVVFVQRPALLNLELAAKNGLDSKALLGTH